MIKEFFAKIFAEQTTAKYKVGETYRNNCGKYRRVLGIGVEKYILSKQAYEIDSSCLNVTDHDSDYLWDSFEDFESSYGVKA
jgi:hypothetical protein